ncbi:BQ2448_2047 [Microbotryum intermedium]|uniref:BQ2448_2047 protein n=1 Tax=Microbotryum intermedium TaxID=269621 RepID=A0A238F798_9BASI|nr:BQ2448_2047 [Microbotryum intermedium]
MTSGSDPSGRTTSTTLMTTTLSLAHEFIKYDVEIDRTAFHISALLRTMLTNAQRRVELVYQLTGLRDMRERTIREEQMAQQRSRTVLVEARREMTLQSRWSSEIEVILDRAAQEGLDVTGPPQLLKEDFEGNEEVRGIEALPAMVDALEIAEVRRQLSASSPLHETTNQDENEERAELYKRQLYYLHHATLNSEHRLKRNLTLVSSSSTASVTRSELLRLHTISVESTNKLALLSVERREASQRLRQAEDERERAEEKRDEVVLDLILIWDATRNRFYDRQ